MNSLENDSTCERLRLGVVSYLNSKPLIAGLAEAPHVDLHLAVPSALADMLHDGVVDASLMPVVDLARSAGTWERVSDACIASDGRTLTVRVFSKVPPEQVEVLHVDTDSHTSVALARIIWANVYRRPLCLEPMVAPDKLRDCEAVLLIGDKVVTTPMLWFDYHVDLGDAWKKWTGLPFVFAVWAMKTQIAELGAQGAGCRAKSELRDRLAAVLSTARDRGVAQAREIAAEMAPAHSWPVPLAVEYMTHALMYTVTPAALAGMNRFFELLAESDIVPEARACIS